MSGAGRRRFAGSEALALLGQALSPGTSVQAQDAWRRYYDMPSSWMIDPVALASQAQDPGRYGSGPENGC